MSFYSTYCVHLTIYEFYTVYIVQPYRKTDYKPIIYIYIYIYIYYIVFTRPQLKFILQYVVVIDLPLLRVAVEGSDNPVSLEKPCQASLPPDQQGRHSLGRHPEVQYVA